MRTLQKIYKLSIKYQPTPIFTSTHEFDLNEIKIICHNFYKKSFIISFK